MICKSLDRWPPNAFICGKAMSFPDLLFTRMDRLVLDLVWVVSRNTECIRLDSYLSFLFVSVGLFVGVWLTYLFSFFVVG